MTGPGRLIVLKHAMPVLEHAMPPRRWRLSAKGLGQAVRRTATLPRPCLVATSREPKARATGRAMAARWRVPFLVMPGLEEIDRRAMPWLPKGDRAALLSGIFQRRSEAVLGRETGRDAARRMLRALSALATSAPPGDIVVVSHGTVMALAMLPAEDAFATWSRLGEMDALVTRRRSLRVLRDTRVYGAEEAVTSAP